MKLIQIKPPQIAWLLLGVSIGLHFLLPQRYRGRFSCLPCGIVGFLAGFGLMMWAWSLFRKKGTAIRPTDQATSLVTSGPFRFSRNPMYLGIVMILLGIAVYVGSLPMLIAPVGFVTFMTLVFIPYEERRLDETFGDAYAAYRRKVRRWL